MSAGLALGSELPKPGPLTIVALGDSTTAVPDWTDQIDEVYADCLPGALAHHGIHAQVRNAGIGDTTTREARERLDRDVRRFSPDLVVIQFGINDSWIDADEGRTEPRLTRDEYRDNLRYLVRTLRGDGARVVLMTPNPMRWSDPFYVGVFRKNPGLLDTESERGINRLLDVYAQGVRAVASEEGVPLVDVHRAFEDHASAPGRSIDELLLAGDGIHPNSRGQRLVCQLLADQIVGLNPGAPADTLIRHARVYTQADATTSTRAWEEAVAIKGDRIFWVGRDSEADRLAGPNTTVIDAGGRLMLPGFIDSHNHIRYGSDPLVLSLSDAATLVEIRERVGAFAAAHPELEWIEASGWAYHALPGRRMPRATDLDGVAAGRPLVLTSYDAHTVWLNREAMSRLGLRPGTRLADSRLVVKDPADGAPTGAITGMVATGSADPLLERLRELAPSGSPERAYRSLRASLEAAARYGITTIVDPQVELEALPLYERARASGDLKSRLQIALFHPVGTNQATLDGFLAAHRRLDDDRLRVSALKLYIDDVIEAHTAALLEPYADMPGGNGDTFYPPRDFDALVARLETTGLQLFIHAIGDRGVRTALDALEHAQRVNGTRDRRHQLVHVELVAPADVPRFGALGVVACMQPRHALLGAFEADGSARPGPWALAVGAARLANAFPWRSLQRAGATIAFSSDWDVSEMQPLLGIYTAVTRTDLAGHPRGGWLPDQRLDLASAVRAYTRDGAWANFLDGTRGSIEPGKYADLILLSDDIFAIAPDRIKNASVVLTMVGGGVVQRGF